MKKEIKLINKIKRFLRRLKCPKWLNKFGSKKYEFLDHILSLLLKSISRLSYRGIKQFLDITGVNCPSKSSLQRTAQRLNAQFWNELLKLTAGKTYLAAIDSTGFSRTKPSYYYLRRINGNIPRAYVKLNTAFDTRKKKFPSAKIRIIPRHDTKDVKELINKAEPKIIVADKGYDAEWLHQFCLDKNVKVFIPIRKRNDGKPKHYKLSLRNKAFKNFNWRTYHRRELVEAGFSAIKRRFGDSVNSHSVRGVRTEIYSKLVCYNLLGKLLWFSI